MNLTDRQTVLRFRCFAVLWPATTGASFAQNPAGTTLSPGRVLHVAQAKLPDVPEQEQFRTISAAAQAVAPGDTVMIHDGVYRESVVVEKSGTADRPIRFEAAPAARVIIDGADVITGWRSEKQDRRQDLQRGLAAPVHRLVEDHDPPGRRSPSPDRASRAGVRPGLSAAPGPPPRSDGARNVLRR